MDPRSEMQKMLAGELYDAGDAEIQTAQTAAKHWMAQHPSPGPSAERG